MTTEGLIETIDRAAEDLAHARRAVAAAGRTEDRDARWALYDEAEGARRRAVERLDALADGLADCGARGGR